MDLLSTAASVEQFSPLSFWQTPPEKNSAARLAPCSVQTGKNKRSCVRLVKYHTGIFFKFFKLTLTLLSGVSGFQCCGRVSLLPTKCFVGYPVHGENEVVFEEDVAHDGEEIDEDEGEHSGEND